MNGEQFLDGKVTLYNGDSRDVLKSIPDNSIDSVVTDPPYALVSIVKRFGGESAAPAKDGDVYARASAGFMGKQWDTGETAFAVEFWAEVMRVLKPGGHVVAASGTRTYHRLAVAIEDAGFEIRDQILWLYGSGFPKSHDVSKGIDKAAGGVRDKVRHKARPESSGTMAGSSDTRPWIEKPRELGYHEVDGGEPATPEAAQWQGWGTALKPACEPWVLARKPLIGTVAVNVLEHGTGALNIDACRVGADIVGWGGGERKGGGTWNEGTCGLRGGEARPVEGRWPANVIHDDALSEEWGRYFYSAKADAIDRIGSKHPTVKPVDLMQYLCRLITPPGGVVLDPFAGSGSTGEAAWREGFRCVLIERETDYAEDIRERLRLADQGVATKKRAIAKKKHGDKPIGGLFA